MAIKIGNSDLKDCYVGVKPVQKIYQGSNLIWERVQPELYIKIGSLPLANYIGANTNNLEFALDFQVRNADNIVMKAFTQDVFYFDMSNRFTGDIGDTVSIWASFEIGLLSLLPMFNCRFNSLDINTKLFRDLEYLDVSNYIPSVPSFKGALSFFDTSLMYGLRRLSINGNSFNGASLDTIFNSLNSNGQSSSNGSTAPLFYYSSQSGAGTPTISAVSSRNALISKGWNIVGNAPA